MIYGIVGKPGGGKSYEAVVYHIIPALSKGRKVITNLPLNVDLLVKTFGEEIRALISVVDGKLTEFGSNERPFSTIEDYSDDWRNENGQAALYVVDEAHMVLPARGCNVPILEWYSMHRHHGIDIVLITQNLRKLNRDIKDMIELTYSCQKNTALGSSNTYTQKVKTGASGETVNTSQRKYKKTYFKYYQSHTASNDAIKEAYASDVKSIWRSWPIIGSVIFLLFGIGMSINAYLDITSEPDVSNVPVVVSPVDEKDVSNVPAVVSPVDEKSNFNPTFIVPDDGGNTIGWLGPLDNYDFYSTGHVEQTRYKRNGDTLESDGSLFIVYFDAYLNNKFMFSTTNYQLADLGYEVKTLSECVYSLSFDVYRRIVTCAPRIMQKDDDMDGLAAAPLESAFAMN